MCIQLRPNRSSTAHPNRSRLCIDSSIHSISTHFHDPMPSLRCTAALRIEIRNHSNPRYLRLSLSSIWTATTFSKRNRLTIPNIDSIFLHFNSVRLWALSVLFFKLFIFQQNGREIEGVRPGKSKTNNEQIRTRNIH